MESVKRYQGWSLCVYMCVLRVCRIFVVSPRPRMLPSTFDREMHSHSCMRCMKHAWNYTGTSLVAQSHTQQLCVPGRMYWLALAA